MKPVLIVCAGAAILAFCGCYAVEEGVSDVSRGKDAGDAGGGSSRDAGNSRVDGGGGDETVAPDSGMDGGTAASDAGGDDADPGDAGITDTGGFDAGTEDGGAADAGVDDGGGPDTGAGDAGGGDGGMVCVTGAGPVSFAISDQQPVVKVELPVDPGVNYVRATVSFEFKPTDWHEPCYNPIYSPPRLGPAFNYLVELRRGAPWCNGGNLYELKLRGPSPRKVTFETYYKDKVYPKCGSAAAIEHKILNEPSHSLDLGQFYPVTVVYDTGRGVAEIDIGGSHWEGALLPEALMVPNPDPFHFVFGVDKALECYNSAGEEDPSAACCHIPPWGWEYKNVTYEVCR
ncbi:MAG: hypothetical protein HY897_20315 [Deltaproteobacteria bacterium]|nr:hypothetical protein [Deltaproteobacteria bacterium]